MIISNYDSIMMIYNVFKKKKVLDDTKGRDID